MIPVIDNPRNFKIVSCIKLLRIMRLGRLINYLNSTDDFKVVLKLIKIIFLLCIYIHCFGCFWYFVNAISGLQWIPAQYATFDEYHEIKGMTFDHRTILDRYSFCVYNALL